MQERSEDTRARLLRTAAELIAAHGFEGTSVRMITSAAGANVSAVSFHFGSREGLLEAVLREGLERLLAARLSLLDAAAVEHPAGIPLEAVLHAFVEPLLRMSFSRDRFERSFLAILARTLAESSSTYARLLKADLAEGYGRFLEAFVAACPHLAHEELVNRLDFAIGAIGHALADSSRREAFLGVRQARDRRRLAPQLEAFLVAGFRARPALLD